MVVRRFSGRTVSIMLALAITAALFGFLHLQIDLGIGQPRFSGIVGQDPMGISKQWQRMFLQPRISKQWQRMLQQTQYDPRQKGL